MKRRERNRKTAALWAIAAGWALVATAEVTVQPQVQMQSAAPATMPRGTADAFGRGELFYNAAPSTPGPSSTLKVIEGVDDKDFVIKTYKIKTQDIATEIAAFLATPVELEGGKVKTSFNLTDNAGYVIVTAPIFQFTWLDRVVAEMDRLGTQAGRSGRKNVMYRPKHRLASDLNKFILTDGTPRLTTFPDDRVNVVNIQDTPAGVDKILKDVEAFDVPAEMVRIEAQIVEIESDDDFNFGLALEAWKEALPERVDTVLNFEQKGTWLTPGPDTQAKNALESINIQGMRPKAAANLINYLVRTGKAKVLSSPTVVAVNGQQATLSSLDVISYTAYSKPENPLNQSASTGVSLTITPVVAQETISLTINASVNSLVGFASANNPMINTRTTTANAILQDGEMFTLSGLKKDTLAKEDERVPILGSIPMVGYFFRHEIDVTKSSEIIVFLTPHKVTPSTGVLERERGLLQKTDRQAHAEETKTGLQKFVDRVILNKNVGKE